MQAPSTVNNCAREDKAAIRRWYEEAEWIDFGFNVNRTDTNKFEVTSATSTAVSWFEVNRRLRLLDGSNTIYGSVSEASISAANTNITVLLDSGSLTSSLSQVDVGIIRPTNNTNSFPLITPFVAYTPTFVGFGTVSSVEVWSRRVGDILEIRGRFTSGTSTATEARINLGFNGTDGNVTSSSTLITSIQVCGDATTSAGAASSYHMLIESNVGYMTIGIQNAGAGGLTKRNGSAALSSGDSLSFVAFVPVSTWP